MVHWLAFGLLFLYPFFFLLFTILYVVGIR